MSRASRGAALVMAALALFAYADVLRTLQWQWSSNDAFAHGYLIPVISAWLLWARRDRLFAAPVAPSPVLGIAVLAVGGAMLLAGRLAGISGLQELSLIVTLAGLVAAVLGWPALRVVALPLLFLVFMMPIWDVLTDGLHEPFQQLSARLGSGLMSAWHVPVNRNGTLLYLPRLTLEVAKACSGVNYLVAVLALAIPLACLALEGMRRVWLVAFAIVVAILANALRIALIGLLAYHGLSQDLHGPGHVLQGLFVAVVGYAAIFGALTFLAPRSRQSRPAHPPLGAYVPQPHPKRVIASTVAVCCVLPLLAWGDTTPTLATLDPVRLPHAIGQWTIIPEGAQIGVPLESAPAGVTWHGYRSPDGYTIRVYAGPYTNASVDGVDGYWTDRFNSIALQTALGEESDVRTDVNSAVVQQNGHATHYYYWYVLNRYSTAARPVAKLYGLVHRIARRGELPVVVVVAIPGPAATPSLLRKVSGFSRDLSAALQQRRSTLVRGGPAVHTAALPSSSGSY